MKRNGDLQVPNKILSLLGWDNLEALVVPLMSAAK